MKKVLSLLLVILVMITLPVMALADTGRTSATVTDILIQHAVDIAAAFLMTLIGVFGAWLSVKLGKVASLNSVNAAQKEVINLAQITVGELQQTIVDGLKAASKDGKLSQDEVKQLGKLLLEKTIAKMSEPTTALLEAAKVDVAELIVGAGESWIATLKQEQ